MRKDLPAYPAYRDSGIEWIGQVPEGWEVWRLRFLAPLQGGYAFKSEAFRDEGVAVVRMNDIKRGALDFTDVAKVEDGPERFRLRAGDLLLGMSGSIGETGSLGNWAWVKEDDLPCFLNQRVGRFVCSRHVLGGLLAYLIQSKVFTEPILLEVTGTAQFNISPSQVGDVSVPLPPLPEQHAIVTFLDRETAKIDRLKDVRRRQIEVLREQRAAVIHHAVTQGLDPDAPKKDSGIPWLGEVPKHWEVRRLKYWADHCSVQVNNLPDGARYLALEHIESKTGKILPDDGETTFESSVKIFRAGDVLFGRLRPYLAKVVCPDFNGVCVGELMVIRPRKGQVLSCFLHMRLLTQSFIDLVDGSTQGAKMPRANWWFMGNQSIPMPPLAEQEAIVAHIDAETATIDALIGKYERELELLDEYRASLISHAVTGKIDVRSLV